jgi:hypothetical protein
VLKVRYWFFVITAGDRVFLGHRLYLDRIVAYSLKKAVPKLKKNPKTIAVFL